MDNLYEKEGGRGKDIKKLHWMKKKKKAKEKT